MDEDVKKAMTKDKNQQDIIKYVEHHFGKIFLSFSENFRIKIFYSIENSIVKNDVWDWTLVNGDGDYWAACCRGKYS